LKGEVMGYRPEITDCEDSELCFYGTKLFGYFNASKLESCQYLFSIGKVKDPNSWYYEHPNEMVLTAEQFKTFIELYEKDYNRIYAPYTMSEHSDYWMIRAMLERDTCKHLEWF
jgi:hypothetical protein